MRNRLCMRKDAPSFRTVHPFLFDGGTPTYAPYACLCTHTNFELGQTANVVCDLRRITEVWGCVGIVTSLGRVVSLSFGWLEVLN